MVEYRVLFFVGILIITFINFIFLSENIFIFDVYLLIP